MNLDSFITSEAIYTKLIIKAISSMIFAGILNYCDIEFTCLSTLLMLLSYLRFSPSSLVITPFKEASQGLFSQV